MHRLDRADVEPARRRRGDEHARLARELAREHDLLQVAARELRAPACRAPAPHAVARDQRRRRARGCGRRRRSGPARRRRAAVRLEHEVRRDAEARRDARCRAGPRARTRRRRDRIARIARPQLAARDATRGRRSAARMPAIVSASSRCPLPATPAIRDDLAARAPRARRRAAPAAPRSPSAQQLVELEHGLARPAPRLGRRRPVSSSRPTISAASERGVASARVDRRDRAPAAQHGDAVGDRLHLVQLVRDEDRPSARRPPSRAASRRARPPPAA